ILAAPPVDVNSTPAEHGGLSLLHRSGDTKTVRRLNAPSYLRPPDTARVSPVMYLESDDARNTAAGAISSGCPTRPSGACVSTIFWKSLPTNPVAWVPSVSIIPGLIAFTRIFRGPSSFASTPVIASTPALLAA